MWWPGGQPRVCDFFFLDKTIGAFEAQVLDGLFSPREFGMFPFGGQEASRGYVTCFLDKTIGAFEAQVLDGLVSPREFGMFPCGGQEASSGYVIFSGQDDWGL